MRKLMIWFLAALLALSGFTFAEGLSAAVDTFNGGDAVRTLTDLYLPIPDGERQMLVRVPVGGGDPVCVDRADRFEDLIPYGSGLVYLKRENGSSAIVTFNGAEVYPVYGFGSSAASSLSYYGGKLLVLIDGQLHSIDPATQLCLRLSSTAMLDYVLGGGNAYFLSAGDRMEYTATLQGGETASTQAGCVYSLDLSSGETTLLLKSGGTDLKIYNYNLYFRNLADAYAMRTGDTATLMGRVYGLDVQLHVLNAQCTEPDNGFWPLDRGVVVWYNGSLNMDTEAGTLSLYNPENGATVVSDGENLYIWEPGKQTLTQVQTNAQQSVFYTGNLNAAPDLSLLNAAATPDPNGSDLDPNSSANWFTNYLNDDTAVLPMYTPIGATPSPAPTAVIVNNGVNTNTSTMSGTTSNGSYSVNTSYLRVTGNSVNIRSGAGTGYSIKGSVTKGQRLTCTGTAAKDSGGNTWYQVNYNGSTGWISAGYVTQSSGTDLSYCGPEVSMSGSTVTVTGSSVNVRAKPCLNGSDMGIVKKGDTLTFKGKKSTDDRGIDWYKVSYNGKTGWISSVYSKVSGSGSSGSSGSGSGGYKESSASGTFYTTGQVNLRTGAGLFYSVITTVGKGTEIEVTAKAKDDRGVTWYKTTVDGTTGWISSANLTTKSSPDDEDSSSGGSSTGTKVIATGQLTIRKSPNKDSGAVVGYMAKGKKGDYLGESKKDSRGVVWYKISYNGMTGWVSSRYSYLK